MTLKVLGSESTGNCYLLENNDTCLILEAGIRFQEVKHAIDFKVEKIIACIVTHQHLDHCKYILNYTESGVDVYTTSNVINTHQLNGHRIHLMKIGLLKLGDFLIRSFSLPHNVPNVGFLIRHPEIGVLLFVTDAAYIKQRFIGLNHILIEANYQEEYLVNDRAVGNHMSLEQTMRFMRSNAMSQVYNIVLLHLSSSNSNAKAFSKMISDTVPHANVYIADKGVNIELQKKPF